MANTEDIEAKLCAYVDGELDSAGVAEIERHLTTNPQHARLIAELTQTRDMVQALPHEPAPVDILEALQGQLERSVLLEDGVTNAPSLRISHWAQVRAIAAVLFLAVGLAAVLYYVLPSPNPPAREFVTNENPTAPASENARHADRVLSLEPTLPGTVVVSNGAPDITPPPSDRDASTVSLPQAREMIALWPNTVLPLDVTTNALTPEHDIFDAAMPKKDPFEFGGDATVDELRVVVSATDVSDARDRVRAYLESNGIPHRSSSPDLVVPGPLEIAQSQIVISSIKSQVNVVIGAGPTTASSDTRIVDDENQPSAPLATPPAPGSAAEAHASPSDEQNAVTITCQMRRGDVATMCDAISDRIAGRSARVEAEPGPDRRNRQKIEQKGSKLDVLLPTLTGDGQPSRDGAKESALRDAAGNPDEQIVSVRIVLVENAAEPESPPDAGAIQPATAPALDATPPVK